MRLDKWEKTIRYDNFNNRIKLDIVDKATRWDNLNKKWDCTIEKRQIDITILIKQFEDYLSLVKFSKSENTLFFLSLILYGKNDSMTYLKL